MGTSIVYGVIHSSVMTTGGIVTLSSTRSVSALSNCRATSESQGTWARRIRPWESTALQSTCTLLQSSSRQLALSTGSALGDGRPMLRWMTNNLTRSPRSLGAATTPPPGLTSPSTQLAEAMAEAMAEPCISYRVHRHLSDQMISHRNASSSSQIRTRGSDLLGTGQIIRGSKEVDVSPLIHSFPHGRTRP